MDSQLSYRTKRMDSQLSYRTKRMDSQLGSLSLEVCWISCAFGGDGVADEVRPHRTGPPCAHDPNLNKTTSVKKQQQQ